MVDVSDDVWLLGSLILANVSEVWWVSIGWLSVATWIAVRKLDSIWRGK